MWSTPGSFPSRSAPIEAIAGPICHSVPRIHPAALSEKSSAKYTVGPTPPPQVPLMQIVFDVHDAPSSHAIPSFAGEPLPQTPPRHVVLVVQGLKSSQA